MGSEADPDEKLDLIVANPTMIEAYRTGIPANEIDFPVGAKTLKIVWIPKQHPEFPYDVKVPDTLAGVGCMVKDSKRFPDTGGWGWRADLPMTPHPSSFKPNTTLQGNDAKCGFECHTIAEAKDFVFTESGKR